MANIKIIVSVVLVFVNFGIFFNVNFYCTIFKIMLVMPTRRLSGTLLSLHISHQRDAIEPSRDKPSYKMYRSISYHVYSSWACWHHEYCQGKVRHIILVMPTRSLLPGTPCFLGSCAIHIHFNASMASHSIATMARGGTPPPPHLPRLNLHFYCFDIGSREPSYAFFQQNPIE